MSEKHIPEFFLSEELIAYLKRTMEIRVTVAPFDPVSDPLGVIAASPGDHIVNSSIVIDGHHITGSTAVMKAEQPRFIAKLETELKDAKNDIGNLIHHLLAQQKRIEALEKHLQQYTTAT
jgi:hypothetical protein